MSQSGILTITDYIIPPDVATRFDGNSGVATPSLNTITISGTGSITTSASGSTLSISLTGLTNHSVLLGEGTSTITSLANGTTGQVLTATTGSNPSWQNAATSGVTLTPDSGGALGPSSTFSILGQQAGTVATMETYGSGTTIKIADQTWATQYVVDPSVTAGLKGTFTTINAAMTQAIADGNTSSTYGGANIQIRAGTYSENIEVTANNYFRFQSFGANQVDGGTNVALSGTITIDASGFANFTSVQLLGIITNSGNIETTNCGIYNAFVGGSSSANVIYNSVILLSVAISGGAYFSANNSFLGGVTFTDDGTCLSYFYLVLIEGSTSLTIEGQAFFYCCFGDGSANALAVSGAGQFNLYNCSVFPGITGSSSATQYIVNSSFASPCSATAQFEYSNVSLLAQYGSYVGIFGSSATPLLNQTGQGNMLQTTRVSGSYDVLTTDYYIGVTSTAGAYTITLPATSTIAPNQVFIIKDESGGAHTHNITVVGATGNIDGAASQVITQNYGSFSVTNDGSNFFIM